MPNHIRIKLYAPPEVRAALLNAEGHVDFAQIVPYPAGLALLDGDSISLNAESAAKNACGVEEHPNPMIAALERHNRAQVNMMTLSDDAFEQALAMIRNYRATGYLHSMDFQRDKWGTKWNAYDQCPPESGCLIFSTANSTPEPVFAALSARFPTASVEVLYADEDIGHNCGRLRYRAGRIVEEHRAIERQLTGAARAAERQQWCDFARTMWGRPIDEEDEDDDAHVS